MLSRKCNDSEHRRKYTKYIVIDASPSDLTRINHKPSPKKACSDAFPQDSLTRSFPFVFPQRFVGIETEIPAFRRRGTRLNVRQLYRTISCIFQCAAGPRFGVCLPRYTSYTAFRHFPSIVASKLFHQRTNNRRRFLITGCSSCRNKSSLWVLIGRRYRSKRLKRYAIVHF